jgi:hypothetical protein
MMVVPGHADDPGAIEKHAGQVRTVGGRFIALDLVPGSVRDVFSVIGRVGDRGLVIRLASAIRTM